MQPIQPLAKDEHGVMRFKPNTIVRYLLGHGGLNLNDLTRVGHFPDEDWEQFAQLIGYSLSGFSELSYVSNKTYRAAELMSKEPRSDLEARDASLREVLGKMRANRA